MSHREYKIFYVGGSSHNLKSNEIWESIPLLKIDTYLWEKNNYQPKVEVKLFYTDESLVLFFRVFENEVTARYTKINEPVHKDSCVEFFINLFPSKTDAYFNFEVNPIGTMHVGFGALGHRIKLPLEDIQHIDIKSTLQSPVIGNYGSDNWEVIYRIPISLLEKYYELTFNGGNAKGNFYKCGDETKFEHYGVWNNIISRKPNFHLPNYFGDLFFEK